MKTLLKYKVSYGMILAGFTLFGLSIDIESLTMMFFGIGVVLIGWLHYLES